MPENFLATLRGKICDKPIWTADLSYWISARRKMGKGDPAWDSEEGYLDLHRELGVMPYYFFDCFFGTKMVYDDSVTVRQETDGEHQIEIWQTPLGELRRITMYVPQSFSTAFVRYPLNCGEDLRKFLYLLQHGRLEPSAHVFAYPQRLKKWRHWHGIPALGLMRSPLACLMVEWAGLENLVYLLMDCQPLLQEILAEMTRQEAPVLEAVCSQAPPVVHFPDNLSSENMTPFYDQYLAPVYEQRLQRLQAAGISCAIHLDGTVRGLLPKLAASGFDAVEALTPAPVGDCSAAEMKALTAGTNSVLWGGVPGAMFAPPYTWEDMKKHVCTVLDAWKDVPFILGVADQVPPDGNIEFCRRIAELVENSN